MWWSQSPVPPSPKHYLNDYSMAVLAVVPDSCVTADACALADQACPITDAIRAFLKHRAISDQASAALTLLAPDAPAAPRHLAVAVAAETDQADELRKCTAVAEAAVAVAITVALGTWGRGRIDHDWLMYTSPTFSGSPVPD